MGELPVRSITETGWEFRQKRLASLQTLRARFPDDMFVQRDYINLVRQTELQQVTQEYRALYERNPDDPRLAFLYGILLEGQRSAEAIRVLEGALAKHPEYPWPHRPLARIYAAKNFLNKDLADKHDAAFLEACPAEVASYNRVPHAEDKTYVASIAAKLRALVEQRPGSFGASSTLWSLEFKSRPTAEFPQVRQQVARDLEKIRSLKLENNPAWYGALLAGYKLVNNPEQADWAQAEQERRFPPPMPPAMSKWRDGHPDPSPDDPPGKKREFYGELLKQTDEWIKARPNYAYTWFRRLEALANLEGAPADEILSAAEKFVQGSERDTGPQGTAPYVYLNTASALSKKHLAPERVLALADKGIARADTPVFSSDLNASKEDMEFYKPYHWLRGTLLQTRALLDLKRTDEAAGRLTQFEEKAKPLKSLVGDDLDRKETWSSWMINWWTSKARVAQLQGREQDAMAYYEKALLERIGAQVKPESGVPDELAEDASRLWKKLGGSSDAWQTWYGDPASALARKAVIAWSTVNEPLPAFELKDMKGKAWNLASLKGKVTFLNFWASW
jgi:hypothetical protein